MPRRRHTRKHKGGAYVGEGTYGCGYIPALRCEGEAERAPGMFSKLMDEDEAEAEYTIGQTWFKPVDPSQKYFLYPLKKCPINQAVLPNPENNINSCQDKFNSLDESLILQFANGGSDITELPLTAEDYMPYFAAFKNLFDGLLKLHDADIAHMDIKAANIVGQKDTPFSFHFRFIDFGLSINATKEVGPLNDLRYASTYSIWPFETRFITNGFNVNKITDRTVNDFFFEAVKYNRNLVPTDIYYDPGDAYYKKTKTFFKNLYTAFLNLDDDDKLTEVIKKTDVYSLGLVLSTVYSKRIGHYYSHNVKKVNYSPDARLKVDIDGLDAYTTPDVVAWQNEVFNKISIPIYNLVRSMMELHGGRRATIKEAREAYIQLLPEMARLFKPELVRKGLFYKPEVAAAAAAPAPINTPGPFQLSPVERKMSKRRNTKKNRRRAK